MFKGIPGKREKTISPMTAGLSQRDPTQGLLGWERLSILLAYSPAEQACQLDLLGPWLGRGDSRIHRQADFVPIQFDWFGIPGIVWVALGVFVLLIFLAFVFQVLHRGRQEKGPSPQPSDRPRTRRSALPASKEPVFPFAIGHRTDVGKKRSLNEDFLFCQQAQVPYRSTATSIGVFAVADGIGGQQAGDVASKLTIEMIAQHASEEIFTQEPQLDSPQDWISSAIEAANAAVYALRQESGTNLGSTLVLVLVIDDTAYIGHAGDSRAYWLTSEQIVQLTDDHSLVQRLVEAGQITPEEARIHPRRNIIYRTIGDKELERGDLHEQKLEVGEALLLCSDGLNSMLPDSQIWEIWESASSPQKACDRLIAAANRAGGNDNVTAILVQRIR